MTIMPTMDVLSRDCFAISYLLFLVVENHFVMVGPFKLFGFIYAIYMRQLKTPYSVNLLLSVVIRIHRNDV